MSILSTPLKTPKKGRSYPQVISIFFKKNAFLFNIYLFLLGNISIYDINNTMKTNQTLETALEKNKPSASFEGRSNANDILVIGSRVLKHLTH